MNHPVLTVVVPTRNRPHLVRNQLKFYEQQGFPYELLYVDASNAEIRDANRRTIAEFSRRLNCRVVDASPNGLTNPARRINEQIREHIPGIQTPFVCQSGDDDLFMVRGLDAAVRRMNDAADLSACGGHCILVRTGNNENASPNQRSGQISVFETANSRDDDAYVRVRNNIAIFANVSYSVKRLDVWKRSYEWFSEEGMESGHIETLMSAAVLASGKVERIDELLILRHYHHRNDESERRDLSYEVFDPDFGQRVEAFCTRVKGILDRARVPCPPDADDQIRLAIIHMALSSAKGQLQEKVLGWRAGKSKRSANEVVNQCCDKDAMLAALETVADNTVHGLADPATNSFNRDGL